VFDVPFDPYSGLPVSTVTSNLIDVRDAFDWTLSAWTTGNTTASALTIQTTSDGTTMDDPAAASWSNWTTFTPSAATQVAPILGIRWARILRTPSVASMAFRVNKTVRMY